MVLFLSAAAVFAWLAFEDLRAGEGRLALKFGEELQLDEDLERNGAMKEEEEEEEEEEGEKDGEEEEERLLIEWHEEEDTEGDREQREEGSIIGSVKVQGETP